MDSDTLSSDSSDSCSQEVKSLKIIYKDTHSKATIAVYYALAANLGIFAIKLFFGLLSHSSAMLSESVHSFADSFNSFCLIIGLKRGNRPADKMHPFGYGLEANVWTVIACLLMLGSSIVSIYWGIDRMLYKTDVDELIQHYNFVIIALIFSAIVECLAVNSASNAILAELKLPVGNPLKNFFNSLKNIQNVKSPTTRFVWYEDTAALTGVIIAIIATSTARFILPEEYANYPDGIASLAIGLILFTLALYLFKNYLITLGAAAKPQVEDMIKETTMSINGISEICDLKTMDMGASGLIVNMEVRVDPDTQVRDVDDITERIDERLKNKIPTISHVNIAVQANETEEDWEDKFQKLIQEGIDNSVINRREAKILTNFYAFTDTTVYEVMKPRIEMNCLEKTESIEELMKVVIETGHTRIPIYDENIDNIIGVINAKDIFKILQNGDSHPEINLEELIREVPIVPENKPISNMLNEFISNKVQLALVADEHGGISGLVTIEDLLEEIFGEIWDEYDVEVIERKRIDDNTILLASKMDIDEINERYDLDIPTEEFQTIGGYVFGRLGRLPKVKDEVKLGDSKFIIESMNGNKIEYIKLFRPDAIIDRIEEEEEEQKQEDDINNTNMTN